MVLGEQWDLLTISLWVIAPLSSRRERTVFDEGGRFGPDMIMMLTPLTFKSAGYNNVPG